MIQSLSKSNFFLKSNQNVSYFHLYYNSFRSSYTITKHSTSISSTLLAIKSCSNATQARHLFDKLPQRSSPVYNVMIRSYIYYNQPEQALQLFIEMLTSGLHRPDNYTYPFVLKACSDLSMLNTGTTIHCRAMVSGFESDTYVQNSLLAMYLNCGEKETALRVFDRMLDRTVVSWNTMISGCVRNGCVEEAFMIFDQMVFDRVEFDHSTIVSILPACAHLKDLRRGKWVHELVDDRGLATRREVRNSLVDMYAKCGCLTEARLIFDEMVERDVVSWTAMMGGYVLNGDARNALALCYPMQLEGVRPNSVTMAALLSACSSSSSLKQGKSIHGWVIRSRLESDVVVETALIDMYAKCNSMRLGFCVFTKTSKKRLVPWNAIISGYVHNGQAREAIKLFKHMRAETVDPNSATLISLLPAYANLADLQQAKNIHCYLIRSGFNQIIEIATSLIDIYSKCGSIDSSRELFNMISENDKDIVTWSVIIAAYGTHGHGGDAISLFDRMVKSGVKPNEVTFTSVLHACSHAGFMDEGLRLFKSMFEDHQMIPRTDHYTCIIDLLGRAGQLKKAHELIQMMPFEPNHAVWGALLGACVIHVDVELGEVAAKRLFELEPDNTGNYVLMSKIYAAVGRWEDAENVRSVMSELGLRKSPACSSVEVRNTIKV